MKAKLKSNVDRKLNLNMVAIEAYVSRWKPHSTFRFELTRIDDRTATSPQRGYYYSAILPALMKGCGYDPEESKTVHRQLKIIFFNVQPDDHGIYRDKDIPSVFSLKSDIGPKKRGDFIDWVLRKAAENGEYVE
jgi:hypothetical protein